MFISDNLTYHQRNRNRPFSYKVAPDALRIQQSKLETLHPGFVNKEKWVIYESFLSHEIEELSRDRRLDICLQLLRPRTGVLELGVFNLGQKPGTISTWSEKKQREMDDRIVAMSIILNPSKPLNTINTIRRTSLKPQNYDSDETNISDDDIPREEDFAPGIDHSPAGSTNLDFSSTNSFDENDLFDQLPRPELLASYHSEEIHGLKPIANSTELSLPVMSISTPADVVDNNAELSAMSQDLFPISTQTDQDFHLPPLENWMNFRQAENPIIFAHDSSPINHQKGLDRMFAHVSSSEESFRLNKNCGDPNNLVFEESEGK